MAATGALKARIQLLQAAVARGEATGKKLKPEIQAELESYRSQGLLGGNTGGSSGSGAKPTEAQAKAVGFLTRALGANDQFEKAGVAPRGAVTQGIVDALPDGIANSITSDARQVSENAQRDFITATLRQESGAAIAQSEFDNQRKTFFPVPGDGEDVIKAKAAARRRALDGLIAAAGSVVGDDLRKQYAGYFPDAKGGDQQSGTAGAVAGSGDTPPSGPNGTPPPQNRDAGGELTFNDQLPPTQTNALKLSDEQWQTFQQAAMSGASADKLEGIAAAFGRPVDAEGRKNLEQIAAYYANEKNRKTPLAISYQRDEIKPVDPGDGTFGAVARGVTSNVPFSREIAAGINTLSDPNSTFADNLDHEKGYRAFDEQQHGGAYTTGAVLGSIPLGGVEFTGARVAARAAGTAAVRQGLGKAAALEAADRAYAARVAADAAIYGGAYGAGNADGSLVDRAGAGALSALTSAPIAGAAGYGASKVARALAARTTAKAAAVPAQTEAGRVLEMADRQNIRVLPQDVTDSPTVGRMTAGAAQSPFGSGPVREATDNLYSDFRNRVGELGGEAGTAAEVGGLLKARSAERAAREGARADETSGAVVNALGGAGGDMTGAGQVAQRGVSRWMEQTAERANELYRRVPIADNAPASVVATRATLADLTRNMESNPQLGAMFDNPRLRGYLDALTDRVNPDTGEVIHDGALSWRDLQEFRTRIGDMLDEPRLSEKIAPRQLRALYSGLTQDMEATARGQGENALRAWRRANGYYAARMNRVNDTISKVVGERRDRTPNEAIAKLQSMLRTGSTGDAASFGRIMRSMPTEDARAVRAAITSDARGGRTFDAKALADTWASMSERGRSALLPEPGLRSIMDDAADRAAASTRDPLANKSGEQVFEAFQNMAGNRGDSIAFQRQLASLSPEEANATRALFIHKMGQVRDEASGGEQFSVARFLRRWDKDMTPEAKTAMFGNGELRRNMDEVAQLANRIQRSEALRGHSNTGAINDVNKTTGGLLGAGIAILSGHPIIAAGLAAPAVYQRVSAEVLTSRRLLNWLAAAPKKPNIAAQRAHIARLSAIARSEPAIASDVLSLQSRLADAFGSAPTRLAAQERGNEGAPVQGEGSQQNRQDQEARP